MSELFFHPKVVHIPIALSVLMPLIAGGLLLAWWRGWLPKRTWWVAVLLQGILVISAFVAIDTGGDQEERVEKVLPDKYIEAHEEAADVFTGGAVGVLLIAGAALFLKGRKGAAAAIVATVGTVVVLGLGYVVGQRGGALVYEHGAANAYIPGASPVGAGPGVPAHEHDDDDD